ncbi:MAG: DUF488 domain-containing protein [Candidatus Tectomicrobia bacterium]|uniref:DUF488 domain-containing protein n=1 Tax=Tectimicrobiota bacterium TaxID=2528274 RepID=A0A932M0Y7_UNCTE|nr:DUF488 domain-containing protein [Candidatus Tectomicrobia bacterium]
MGEFLELMEAHGIELVVDVRTVPRSRHVPQFNRDSLEKVLPMHGVAYRHLALLGGLRKPRKDSPNLGWRNESFRGFADYMQEDHFWDGIAELEALACDQRVAIMCAEAVPWRCHRSLIADTLLIHGIVVRHIFSKTKVETHAMTPFAVVQEGRILYPPGGPQSAGNF